MCFVMNLHMLVVMVSNGCKSCGGTLIRGNIPLQTKANSLQVPAIPN